MATERKTENLTRRLIEKCGYTNGFIETSEFIVDEQSTDNPRILDQLKGASKTINKKGTGKPEFLIQRKGDQQFLIVVECKKDMKFHESSSRNKEKDYAIDGVLFYAAALSKEYNVIAVAISGVDENNYVLDTFFYPKGADSYIVLTDKDNTPIKEFLSWDKYLVHAKRDKTLIRSRYEDLMKFSRELHNYMRDYCKITETQKPLLVSGVLLALMDKGGFVDTWAKLDQEIALPGQLYEAIKRVIEDAELGVNKTKKKEAINNIFEFVRYHPELSRLDPKTNETPLYHVVRELATHVKPFTEDHFDFDIIGRFYGEFVRYTGGDKKGLGIVLTPKHITELFAELAKLKMTDTVLDTCTGTASFLIAAMYKMMEQATTEDEKKRIRQDALIGIEQNPEMFALAVANMILRGDGKTNLYQGSCFDPEILNKVSNKADVGFINPPYSQKGDGLHEWDFILNMLDALKKGGTGIVIVPMALAIDQHPLREVIMKKHRLEAVMSMPDDLFYPVGAISCIIVFTAHVPHDSDKHHESWFGYWKDDGFKKDRVEGRVAKELDQWEKKKEEWISMYRKKEIPGVSIWKKVDHKDEWCAEAYLETNYSQLDDKIFEKKVLEYVSYEVKNRDICLASSLFSHSNNKLSLSDRKWEWFPYFGEEGLFLIKTKGAVNSEIARDYPGDVPFVCASVENNGISCFTSMEPTHPGNLITVAKDGNGTSYAFYQKTPFCINTHVLVFYPKFEINVFTGLFLSTLITMENYRYGFGRAFGQERAKQAIIKLPVTSAGTPDWQWMEDYIKSLPYSASL